jgi:hypothetical protein
LFLFWETGSNPIFISESYRCVVFVGKGLLFFRFTHFVYHLSALYNRTYDIIFDNDLNIDVGVSTGLFESHQLRATPIKLENILNRQAIIDLIVDTCLNSSSQQTATNTMKINLTSSTRVLLRRKELQNNYDQYIKELSQDNTQSRLNEILAYHKAYTYYLLLNLNFAVLFEINDSLFGLLKEKNDAIFCLFMEFYLSLLYFIYFTCNRFNKSEFKKKLFAVINFLFKNESLLKQSEVLNTSLQTLIMKYKLNTKSLVDINYLNVVVRNYSKLKINKRFIQTLALLDLNVDLYRLKEINKLLINQTTAHTLGLHTQLKNNLNYYLSILPYSVDLWLFYFQLEAGDQNKILYIYYQSIRNMPFVKVSQKSAVDKLKPWVSKILFYFQELYLKAVEFLPQKFNEILQQMSNKEIRARLPVEELSILLEPMQSKMQYEDEHDARLVEDENAVVKTDESDDDENVEDESENDEGDAYDGSEGSNS